MGKICRVSETSVQSRHEIMSQDYCDIKWPIHFRWNKFYVAVHGVSPWVIVRSLFTFIYIVMALAENNLIASLENHDVFSNI